MSESQPKIVVAGDVAVDWLFWPVPAADEGQRWQLREGTRWAALPGGALRIAAMLRRGGDVDVAAPALADLEAASSDQVLHSLAEVALFPATGPGDRQRVYRVAQPRGYTRPRHGAPSPLPVAGDDPHPAVLVLDDGGNGFRSAKTVWPAAVPREKSEPATVPAAAGPLIVYKMAPPLLAGDLWDAVRAAPADRLVIVVNADHLRSAGVAISQRLSWERTAKDFVWQIACNPKLTTLANARHVVVRFGLEGAVYYSTASGAFHSQLFFDPALIEGGYTEACPGQMLGYSSAFVAALARSLARPAGENTDQALPARVSQGILAGLGAARRLHRLGYGREADIADFPSPAILVLSPDQAGDLLSQVDIPNPEVPDPPDPHFWSILRSVEGTALESLADTLVTWGTAGAPSKAPAGEAGQLRSVPVGQFGKLRTADRAEIEGLRSIRNLIDEFLHRPAGRPLSVAVFGFPGSGKSFAVTQVAESVAGQHKIVRLEFNLSQFRTPEDLCRAFHLVRDTALAGAVPLVFFDEFDTAFEGELGWLKYFLAPMQDGVFREGEATHPIGRAIFVFAGGTYNTFQEFAGLGRVSGEDPRAERRFKSVKGPDFVSRLRGFVNILGPNPVDDVDATYLIRRAMLLRSLIERKAPELLDSCGQARIDDGVLRALLRVPAYRHGARSTEAVLDMSLLAGEARWDQAALPPAEQLALHVDAELFIRLMLRDVLLSGARDVLGRAVHEHYRRNQDLRKPPDDLALQPWDELTEDLRESNRKQADHIPVKLKAIGCSFRPVAGRGPAASVFAGDEVETMARLEHERWMQERRLAGWTYGEQREPEHRKSPYLVPYDDLADGVKDWDREAVWSIPAILALAKFEVYRL